MRRHILILALAVTGAVLAVPAVADATTYCVNAGASCPTGGVELVDPQVAMTQAAESLEDDTLLVGAKDTPYFGPFVYQPVATRGGNRLAIEGIGGRPTLTGRLDHAAVSVTDADIKGINVLADVGEGLGMHVENATVTDVSVIGSTTEDAADTRGILAVGRVRFENTDITGRYETSLIVRGSLAEDGVDARGLRISGAIADGIFVGPFAHLTLSDSRVIGGTFAIQSQGLVEVRRSVLETTRPDSIGVAQNAATSGVHLDHVTVAHRGTPSGDDSALRLNSMQPVDTRLNAVALAGYTRGFRRVLDGFPHNLVIKDSVWDPSRDELGGPGSGVFVESGNAHVAPALANVAGSLRPIAGSAVIDRDGFSDISQFADLDGVPALDGDGDGVVRPDAGAFEFRPEAPVPAPPGGGGGTPGPGPDVTAPLLSGLGLRAGRARVARAATLRLARARRLRLVLTTGEAATVRIVPRRVIGDRLARARGSIVRQVVAGKASIALGSGLRRLRALRAGRLRLFVTATDGAGNRSAKRVLKLRLRR